VRSLVLRVVLRCDAPQRTLVQRSYALMCTTRRPAQRGSAALDAIVKGWYCSQLSCGTLREMCAPSPYSTPSCDWIANQYAVGDTEAQMHALRPSSSQLLRDAQ